jgi:hypothetical protein
MKLKEQIKARGYSYSWYIEQAQAIVTELNKEHASEEYIKEKISNVLRIFEDAKRGQL